ncbi:hypothetical protein ACPC36_08100 [Streptomyces pseudogriseolus]|uniref:hypothetical protein n=1 Tax=Streptomyces pseudogriseolus TaxID=36817 RepID=UPI003FA1E85D
MARLQILQLPEGVDDDRPPFVLVVDEWDVESIEAYFTLTDYWDVFGKKIGARGVLFADRAIDIPANDTRAYIPDGIRTEVNRDGMQVRDKDQELRAANEWIERLSAELDEARQWARHGYEIGQRHCGWSDHGVAPAWLTEGWPPHIDSCEHLKQMAEFDMALTRVRALVDSWCNEPHPSHDHLCPDGVREDIHKAIYGATGEETSKP